MTKPDAQELEAVAALARSLNNDPLGITALSEAAERIAAGQGRPLFDALLATWRHNEDEDAAVVAMMGSLEKMMDVSPGVAGYLMARLHPVAGRRYLHSTRDGIELWMWESRSPDVADSLMRLAQEDVRPRLRESCEEWATRIRSHMQDEGR